MVSIKSNASDSDEFAATVSIVSGESDKAFQGIASWSQTLGSWHEVPPKTIFKTQRISINLNAAVHPSVIAVSPHLLLFDKASLLNHSQLFSIFKRGREQHTTKKLPLKIFLGNSHKKPNQKAAPSASTKPIQLWREPSEKRNHSCSFSLLSGRSRSCCG